MKRLLGQSTADTGRSGEDELEMPARAIPAANSEQAFFHLDVRRSLQLHWRLARRVAMGAAALAVLYLLVQVFVFKAWPMYQAESIVYVNPTASKVLELAQGGSPRWPFDSNSYETYIQQQMMNVSREDVLYAALHQLEGFQRPEESDQVAAQRLVRLLEVTRSGSAYQFSILARSSDPSMAAQIANAITASYIESASRDERTGDAQRLSILREERDRIQNALAAERSEQDALNKQLGVAAVGTAVPDHFDEDITQIHSELVKARTDHDAAEARFTALDAGHGPSSTAIDAEADGMIASDAGLVSMKTALNTRRATLISQMANETPANPQYKQDEAELTKINNTLDAMMKDLRAKAAARTQLQLQGELQRTAGVESQLNGQLRQLVGTAAGATPKLQRSSDLAADITRLQTRYAAVDEQLHNLLLEDSAPAAAYQVTPAVAPLIRSKSGVLRNAILIAVAGLFFGVLTAVVVHRIDPRIYIASDVEQVLGIAPLALLPDFTEVSESVWEEYLLRLASALEHARKQGSLKSCLFTGTGSGAGVTTLVNRVRGMLEAMGRPTVLVDATGASAPASRVVSNRYATGQGLVPVERVSRPTALLQQIAEESEAQEHRLVLTDAAPLAVSAETEYLARFVDCAVVVIESGVTTRAELREVAKTLERLDANAVGFVLNRVGLATSDPAFRLSVEAVETYLQAQGVNRAQQAQRNNPIATLEPAPGTALPQEEAPRGLFEPEVAAAAAAVARLSSSARSAPVSSPDVCLSSPRAFSPLVEPAKRLVVPANAAPVVEAAWDFSSPSAAIARGAALKSFAPLTAAPLGEPATHPQAPRNDDPVMDVSPLPAATSVVAAPSIGELAARAERPSVPPPAQEAPAALATPIQEDKPVPNEVQPQPEMPWWLSDAPHLPPLPRPAVIWQPAKAETSGSAGTVQETSVSVPVLDRGQRIDLEPTAESWDRTGAVAQAITPSIHEKEKPRKWHEESPANLTSRLSGLRNLLFVLGVKDGNDGDDPELPGGSGAALDARSGSTNSERGISQTPYDPAGSGGQAASQRLVTAPPEVLPPKTVVVDFDRAHARQGESATRQDRRTAYDGVQILPSKRGQYKRI